MSKKLSTNKPTFVIFVFNKNYDVYVNILASAIDKYGGLDQVILVELKDTLVNYSSKFEKKDLEQHLNNLHHGLYVTPKTSIPNIAFQTPTNFGHYDQSLSLLRHNSVSEEIRFSQLSSSVGKLVKTYGINAIFDITAVPVKMNLQLFLALAASKAENILLFNLREKDENNPFNNLYHQFYEKPKYFDYQNITETDTFEQSFTNKTPKKIYLYLFIMAIVLSTSIGIYLVFQEKPVKVYLVIFQLISIAMMIYSLVKTWGKK